MLFFAAPTLLLFLPLVALLGLWAIWRGKRAGHVVPSTRLWRNLADSAAAPTKRRIVDPVWLLIFLAGLLAAAALPKPAWRTAADPSILPASGVEWSLRSLADQPPEVFVQLWHARNLTTPLTLDIRRSPDAPPSTQNISLTDATAGTIIHVPLAAAQTKVSLRLLAGTHVLAAADFMRPQFSPFALLTRAGPGRSIDPALQRVFAINPQARPDDPRIHPAVLLVNDPDFTLDGIAPDTLVVASPDTPLPGLSLHAPYTPPADLSPVGLSLPAYISFQTVHVITARGATLSADWTPLATLGAEPWLAQRQIAPTGPTLIWLASQPSAQCNWALDRSFVLFFAHALARTFPATAARSGEAHILQWLRTDTPIAPPPSAKETSLTPPLGIAAICLLGIAVALLAWRSRDFSPSDHPR